MNDKLLTSQDYEKFREYGIDPFFAMAVAEVESSGSGFLSDGRVKILFEGHIFWRRLEFYGIDPKTHVKGNFDILYPTWTKSFYKGGAAEHDRLDRAMRIHELAAYESASWGKFQIMGFQVRKLAYPDALQFAGLMYQHERNHLDAFIRYCHKFGLIDEMQRKDCSGFALGYNGPGYKENHYDTKINAAYKKLLMHK
jgi:hypothetical protein